MHTLCVSIDMNGYIDEAFHSNLMNVSKVTLSPSDSTEKDDFIKYNCCCLLKSFKSQKSNNVKQCRCR